MPKHSQPLFTIEDILEQVSEFPVPTDEEWRMKVEKSIKGADFEEQLVTDTYEGISLQPLYRSSTTLHARQGLPGEYPFVRGIEKERDSTRAWQICQELKAVTPQALNTRMMADLQQGQTAVHILLDEPTQLGMDADQAALDQVGAGGVSLSTTEDMHHLLQGIDLTKTPVMINTGESLAPIFTLFVHELHRLEYDLDKVQGCIGMDPLGMLVQHGSCQHRLSIHYDQMAAVTNWAVTHAPQLQTVLVESHPYHGGGGSAVEEMAFTLASGVAYIRALQERGLPIDQIAPRIRFSYSVGPHMFMEMAKLRTVRCLWSYIVSAFGGGEAGQKMYIHGRTSSWTKTYADPYVNMLRATTEAFTAAVGGVQSLHVSPYDEVHGTESPLARRMARHTQLILQEEAHVSKQMDPAGGSWYVETLTEELTHKVWDLFQEVEERGGMLPALQAGFPQQQVEQVAQQKRKNIQEGRDVFVGVNKYVNSEESMQIKSVQNESVQNESVQNESAQNESIQKESMQNESTRRESRLKPEYEQESERKHRQETVRFFRQQHAFQVENHARLVSGAKTDMDQLLYAVEQGATLSDLTALITGEPKQETVCSIQPIPSWRGSEDFEKLRFQGEAYQHKTGKRPQVFLANMGPIPEHKPKADFATGVLEAGGFFVLKNDGFSTVEKAIEAAKQAQAEIVVINAKDAIDTLLVCRLSTEIKNHDPQCSVIWTGKVEAKRYEQFTHAGIDSCLYKGMNIYEWLLALQRQKGVVT